RLSCADGTPHDVSVRQTKCRVTARLSLSRAPVLVGGGPDERCRRVADDVVEARTQEIGAELLERMDRYRLRAAERIQDWLLTDALSDPTFRGRMLRFVDVFAAVEATGDAEE